ncbi:MAG: lectin like domain-containing protein [Coriobacteriales bacterium]|nr:lectin like domain-containing protein [Coriobacteriales bacterium]
MRKHHVKKGGQLALCLLLAVAFCPLGGLDQGTKSAQADPSQAWATVLLASGDQPAPLEVRSQDGVVSTNRDHDPEKLADTSARTLRGQGALPSSYSLIKNAPARLSSVKNQGDHGVCWSFAATASAASSEVSGNLQSKLTELSQVHLVNAVYNDQAYNKAYFATAAGSDIDDIGGSPALACAALSKGNGARTLSAYPYPSGANFPVLSQSSIATRDYALKDAYELPDPLDPASGALIPSNLNAIKQTLVKHGAISLSYHYSKGQDKQVDDSNWRNSKKAYYDPTVTDSINHAVTVVGYDDTYPATNFSQRPPGAGAFLIQNSWGKAWGDQGYFWLSYYDRTYSQIWAFDLYSKAQAEAQGKVQSLDSLGLFATIRSLRADQARFANIFSAPTTYALSQLTSVGFYASAAGQTITADIYLDPGSTPTSGRLIAAASASATADYYGYYTLKLGKAVELKPGQRYAVVLTYRSGGGKIPIPFEFNTSRMGINIGQVSIARGQSFLATDDDWTDIVDFNQQANTSFGNACIKSMVKPLRYYPSKADFSYDHSDRYNGKVLSANISASKGMGKLTAWYAADGAKAFSTSAPRQSGRYTVAVSSSQGSNFAASQGHIVLGSYTITPHGVTALKLKPGKKRIKVSWKTYDRKAINADYYQVYYRQSGSKWKHRRLSSSKAESLTLKLKGKKKYYVKVKACRAVRGSDLVATSAQKKVRTR